MNHRDPQLLHAVRDLRRLGWRADRIATSLNIPLWSALKAIRESESKTSTPRTP